MREQVEQATEGFNGLNWLGKMVIWIFGTAVVLVVLGFPTYWIGRAMFFTWVDNYQFGYTYNYWTGVAEEVPHSGYVYSPFYKMSVHTIDLRPMQVSITSIQRVLNAKLVHFDPYAMDPETKLKGWQLLIKWHGRDDYEGPGTLASSTSSTSNSTQTLFQQIMMNYAYGGDPKKYPFLVIEKEMGDEIRAEK